MNTEPSAVNKQVHLNYPERNRPTAIFLLALAAYFLLQIVIRVSLSSSLDLDEAEQAFVFQQPRLGYDTQPPLYAWLQWLMFSVFGLNLFALSALKNLLLFATYLGMFTMARPLIGVTGAIAASASLILFPQIAWESQRDLTHSVLLTALACGTLWSYFALLRNPGAGRYALFGLLVGLGLQSKYNFALFLAGLMGASLLVAQHRQIVWNRKVWIAIAVALLCLLPHGLWLIDHIGTATGATLDKMGDGSRETAYLGNVARGVGSMLLAVLSFITPLWVIYVLICRRYFRQAAFDWNNPNARFFICLYAVLLALMTMVVLTGEVGKIKGRWMQPLLFSLPLAWFVVLPGLAQTPVFQRILRVAAVFAVIVLVALPLRSQLGSSFGKGPSDLLSYSQLSAELARRFPQAELLVAGDRLTAGNLYFQRPALRTMLLHEVLDRPVPLRGDVLLVVSGNDAGDSDDWLRRFRAAYPQSVVKSRGRLEPADRNRDTQWMPFDYALVHVPGAAMPAR